MGGRPDRGGPPGRAPGEPVRTAAGPRPPRPGGGGIGLPETDRGAGGGGIGLPDEDMGGRGGASGPGCGRGRPLGRRRGLRRRWSGGPGGRLRGAGGRRHGGRGRAGRGGGVAVRGRSATTVSSWRGRCSRPLERMAVRPRRSRGGPRGGAAGRGRGGGRGGGGPLGLGGRLRLLHLRCRGRGGLGLGFLGRTGGLRRLGRLRGLLGLLVADEAFPLGLAANAVGLRVLDARRVGLHADAEAPAEVERLLVGQSELLRELMDADLRCQVPTSRLSGLYFWSVGMSTVPEHGVRVSRTREGRRDLSWCQADLRDRGPGP